jgi:putative hydrolase of the HAD superfamily
MQQVRALTFDLDDTLWDNRPVMVDAEKAVYDWLSRHYLRIKECSTLGGLRHMRTQLAERLPELRYHMTALLKQSLRLAAEAVGYDDSVVEPAFAHFLEARHRVTPYDDVLPALQRLRDAGYRIGALTNGNVDVRRLGIGRLFHFPLSGEYVLPGCGHYEKDEHVVRK